MMPQRDQRIAFREIARDTAFRNIVGDDPQAGDRTLDTVGYGGRQSNQLAFLEIEAIDVILVHQDDMT